MLLFVFSSNLVKTATVSLSQIPVGKVISVNGLKFVKIAANQYLAAEPFGTMQGWHGCASLPNPACMAAGTCTTTTTKSQLFTQGPTLMDARDGQHYEIRKFPDGKCWMVDNLRYGGTLDACAGKTYFTDANGSALASNRFGNNTYGDCRDPHVGGVAPCIAGSTICGYLYNWQAALQDARAYQNNNFQPSQPTQGICPTGWHLPSSESTGEFATLDIVVGGDGGNNQIGNNYIFFWKATVGSTVTSTDPWKTVYFGNDCTNAITVVEQGVTASWWSSNQVSTSIARGLNIGYGSSVHPSGYNNKYCGFGVRCLKD